MLELHDDFSNLDMKPKVLVPVETFDNEELDDVFTFLDDALDKTFDKNVGFTLAPELLNEISSVPYPESSYLFSNVLLSTLSPPAEVDWDKEEADNEDKDVHDGQ